MDAELQRLASTWQARAVDLRNWGAAEGVATAWECAATELTEQIAQHADEALSIQEAASVSGYSADHLSRLLRNGDIPNAGSRNRPRVRRGDLPIKRRRIGIARSASAAYDPATDARALLSRRGER